MGGYNTPPKKLLASKSKIYAYSVWITQNTTESKESRLNVHTIQFLGIHLVMAPISYMFLCLAHQLVSTSVDEGTVS